jgi:surfeit locus 1 family protein
MAVLARLGFWQLDRLEQRRAFNAQLLQALESPPLDLTREELVGDFESMKNRDVVVQGEFDISRQIILKLQNRAGQPGVHLVSPLLIEGTGNAVLVDRGWIPESESGPEADSKFSEPGPVTVYGFVALSQTLSRPAPEDSLPSGPQREWYRVDIEAIQSQMPYELMPFYVTQSPGEDGDDELPFRDEREIDLSEGSHLGYAIQWFIFSATLGIIYIVYLGKANPPSQGEA